jgi:hypothetical protein
MKPSHWLAIAFCLLQWSRAFGAEYVTHQDGAGGVVVTEKDFAFSFRIPAECKLSVHENLPPWVDPNDPVATQAKVSMQIDYRRKSAIQVSHVEDYLTWDVEKTRQFSPAMRNMRYEKVGTVTGAGNTVYSLYARRGTDEEAYLVCFELRQFIVTIVLSGHTKEGVDATMNSFKELIKSYEDIDPHAKRRTPDARRNATPRRN